MIKSVTSQTVKPGKMQEARQLSLDLAAHANKNYADLIEVQVLSNISGPSNRLHTIGSCKSLSDWEVGRERWAKDSKAQELMQKIPEVFENDHESTFFRVES
ncbi:hypothetical protein KFU94_00870 [Chloroflexi bacterium TSY]|nr:hypothetical protein [Chloroflexi bacterium TSY]